MAAIAVVGYHFGTRAQLPYLLPRGYLAVDFFFVLSGFVLAYAYAEKLRATLTVGRFLVQRLIRLLPMLIPGTVFGAVIEIWRPTAGGALNHFIDVIRAVILGCLAIPWPFSTAMEQTIFPINGPTWSLFFELFIGLVFAIGAKTFSSRTGPLILMGLGGAGLVGFAGAYGTLDVGALLIDWPGGFPRVIYSFFAGTLVFANRHRFRGLSTWIFPCILVAIFLIPSRHDSANAVLDLFVVLVVFPLLVGSAANTEQKPGRAQQLSQLSGELSYPLYAVHYPIIRAICFVINKHTLPTVSRLGIGAASICFVLAVSWGLFQFYDRPIRGFLTRLIPPPKEAQVNLAAVHGE